MKYEKSSVKVINPYTFVPISPEKVNDKKREDLFSAKNYYQNKEELHTGVLHCTLQTVTPLAMPDTERMQEKNGHKYYPFYTDRGQYTIPGSSLRGMIRSVYETVTDSCFATVKSDTALSLRAEVSKPYLPGVLVLKKDEKSGTYKYFLYEAKRMLLMIDGDIPVEEHKNVQRYKMKIEDGIRKIELGQQSCQTGDVVWYKKIDSKHKNRRTNHLVWEDGIVSNLSAMEKDGYEEGILFLGEPMGKKKHGESVFKRGERKIAEWDCLFDKNGKPKPEAHYKKLQETLNLYQNEAINKNYKNNNPKDQHRGYKGFEKLDPRFSENGIPIWYRKSEGRIYLSYAAIGRTMYEKTLNELLGELNRCTDRNQLCEACLLFGMVGGAEKEDKGMGSRVRMTDAHAIGSPMLEKNVTLKELGMPRYSYLPFYGGYRYNSGVPNSYDDNGATIAGRKYYWNNKNAVDKNIYSTKIPNKRNASVDLIRPEAQFKFDVYYDGIKEEQLKKLMWVLTFGQNKLPDSLKENENLLCHKVGRGKPLGLGSVKIVIDVNEEREYDACKGDYCLNYIDHEKIEITDLEGASADAVKRVASINPFTEEDYDIAIEYPNIVYQNGHEIPLNLQQNDNKLARHQWYSQNKNDLKKGKGQILPKIIDENQTLSQYYYVERKYGENDKKSKYKGNDSKPNPSIVYSAKILKKIGDARDERFENFQVEIQGDPSFQDKTCILSVRKDSGLANGQIVMVVMYRDFSDRAIFNIANKRKF